MSTSSHPKHALLETAAETVRRLSIEGEAALVEELRGNALMHRSLARSLAGVRDMVEHGATERAVEHLGTCIDIIEEWWVSDSLAVQEYGELLEEQLAEDPS